MGEGERAREVSDSPRVKTVFNNGDYVRLLIAPNTRIGTIEGNKTERGRLHYLFRQDKRVSGEKDTPDFYLLESELEACEPSD
jgi:hypothetical protein